MVPFSPVRTLLSTLAFLILAVSFSTCTRTAHAAGNCADARAAAERAEAVCSETLEACRYGVPDACSGCPECPESPTVIVDPAPCVCDVEYSILSCRKVVTKPNGTVVRRGCAIETR